MVEGSNVHTAPCSSTGAMASPPRPEYRYILPSRVAEAVPTREDGEAEVPFVSSIGWAAIIACNQSMLTDRSYTKVKHSVPWDFESIL
jgi:hypothetical protein